jgi:hypothetical protein
MLSPNIANVLGVERGFTASGLGKGFALAARARSRGERVYRRTPAPIAAAGTVTQGGEKWCSRKDKSIPRLVREFAMGPALRTVEFGYVQLSGTRRSHCEIKRRSACTDRTDSNTVRPTTITRANSGDFGLLAFWPL